MWLHSVQQLGPIALEQLPMHILLLIYLLFLIEVLELRIEDSVNYSP